MYFAIIEELNQFTLGKRLAVTCFRSSTLNFYNNTGLWNSVMTCDSPLDFVRGVRAIYIWFWLWKEVSIWTVTSSTVITLSEKNMKGICY